MLRLDALDTLLSSENHHSRSTAVSACARCILISCHSTGGHAHGSGCIPYCRDRRETPTARWWRSAPAEGFIPRPTGVRCAATALSARLALRTPQPPACKPHVHSRLITRPRPWRQICGGPTPRGARPGCPFALTVQHTWASAGSALPVLHGRNVNKPASPRAAPHLNHVQCIRGVLCSLSSVATTPNIPRYYAILAAVNGYGFEWHVAGCRRGQPPGNGYAVRRLRHCWRIKETVYVKFTCHARKDNSVGNGTHCCCVRDDVRTTSHASIREEIRCVH